MLTDAALIDVYFGNFTVGFGFLNDFALMRCGDVFAIPVELLVCCIGHLVLDCGGCVLMWVC